MANNQGPIVPLRNLEVQRFYKLREPTQLVPTTTDLTQDQNHFDSLHNNFHELILRTPPDDENPFFQFQPTVGDQADAYMAFDPRSFPNGLDTEFILYVPSAGPMANLFKLNVPRTQGGKRKYSKSQKRRKMKSSKKRKSRNR